MVTPMPKRRRRYRGVRALVPPRSTGAGCHFHGLVVLTVIAGFVAVVAVQVGPAERIYVRSIDSGFAASVTPIAEE